MSAEHLLRRYLEQRRELGERELVLDGLSVDEVMRIIGAASSRPQAASTPRQPGGSVPGGPSPATASPEAMRREAGAPPGPDPADRDPVPRPATLPAAVPAASITDPPAAEVPVAPTGLVVDAAERELFGGPIGQAESLEAIAGLVQQCRRCPLYATATHAVPGEGSPHSRLMCVGEAPGANEDATGRPFVGQAGQLLTKILSAINLTRDEVFIANVLKHRPPGNRNPRPEEVEACRPYLVRQIELIRPAVIVAFGTFAAQTLLETKLPIGKLRGLLHRYHGVPLIVTYHPAALLRNPAWKRPTWEDVQLARRLLDRAAT